MPINKCKNCKKEFYVKPCALKKGWGQFCSSDCHYINSRAGEYKECFICKEKIYKNNTELNRSKSKKYFCSKSCQTKWRNTEYKGDKHLLWKGGSNIDYRKIILNSGIIEKCTLCDSEDKRVLAVHHVDKNRKNCNISNLAWLCHNCHHLVHFDKTELNKFLLRRNNMATIV